MEIKVKIYHKPESLVCLDLDAALGVLHRRVGAVKRQQGGASSKLQTSPFLILKNLTS